MHLAIDVISFLILLALLRYVITCVCEQEQKTSKVKEQCKIDDLIVDQIKVEENNDISIIILAAARNAMVGLPSFLSNVRRIKKSFPQTRIIFIENDSIDGTRDYITAEFPLVLSTLVIDPNFIINKRTKSTGTGKDRVEKMAALRNQLLTHVKDTDKYVMMCDPDWNICISIKDFAHAIEYLEQNNQTAGVVPMLRNRLAYFPFVTAYFDTFAFQSEEFPDPAINTKEKIRLHFKQWPEDDPIPVESAFGSFAIYRQDDIKDVKYSVIESTNGSNNTADDRSGKTHFRCEHVGFHKSIRETTQKRIELLPWFKIIA